METLASAARETVLRLIARDSLVHTLVVRRTDTRATIRVFVVAGEEIRDLSGMVAAATERKRDPKIGDWGVVVRGNGLNHGAELVGELARILYGDERALRHASI